MVLTSKKQGSSSIDPRLAAILSEHNGDQLIKILDEQEQCLKDHQKRVASMACKVAEAMHLSQEQQEAIYVAASLHDIGMHRFRIDTNVSKYNRLQMMERFRKHPDIGAELVSGLRFSVPVDCIIQQHHERLDGSGFPHNLTEIMVEAQIIAVVDILDGIYAIHTRDHEIAIDHGCDEIYAMRNGRLDPDIIDLTIALARNDELYVRVD